MILRLSKILFWRWYRNDIWMCQILIKKQWPGILLIAAGQKSQWMIHRPAECKFVDMSCRTNFSPVYTLANPTQYWSTTEKYIVINPEAEPRCVNVSTEYA